MEKIDVKDKMFMIHVRSAINHLEAQKKSYSIDDIATLEKKYKDKWDKSIKRIFGGADTEAFNRYTNLKVIRLIMETQGVDNTADIDIHRDFDDLIEKLYDNEEMHEMDVLGLKKGKK